MIKIVEIKGGLQALEYQKELAFENKGFLIGKARRKGFSGSQGLYDQLRTQERVNVISRAQIEETMGGTSSSRENGITIHAGREGYRQFQEALQEETSRQQDRIIAEERRRETVRILQQMQNMPIILGTGGENEYVAGVDPYVEMPPLTPDSAYFRNSPRQRNPDTGNIEVLQSDGNSITFSRDMTEEQMIAYFDSLN